MLAVKFHPHDRVLVEVLVKLEMYVRANFELEEPRRPPVDPVLQLLSTISNKSLTAEDHKLRRVLVLVLLNYIYDAYLRLLVCGRGYLVEGIECVGTLSFLWSLERAHQLNPQLVSCSDNVQLFSEQLDNLRRTWNIDILMPASIAYLDSVLESGRFSPQEWYRRRSVEDSVLSTRLLDQFKTFYNVAYESRVLDHSTHYEDAYVPMYRFCDSKSVTMSLSRYIGNTMRNNIRSLYRYISRQLNDDQACPCVVIFNLFIRDHYRMYHSKSLRQSGFVRVRRSDNSMAKLSFMVIANNFPRVTNWFNLVNNQLVKKTNKVHIQHLDTFVRLMSQLMKEEETKRFTVGGNKSVSVTPRSVTIAAKRTKRSSTIDESENGVSLNVVVKKKNRIIRKEFGRPSLAAMHESFPIEAILPRLFNANFERCQHKRVERQYEQLRSNDENATLIRVCLECGKRVR